MYVCILWPITRLDASRTVIYMIMMLIINDWIVKICLNFANVIEEHLTSLWLRYILNNLSRK